jgi:hypothetical protein
MQPRLFIKLLPLKPEGLFDGGAEVMLRALNPTPAR